MKLRLKSFSGRLISHLLPMKRMMISWTGSDRTCHSSQQRTWKTSPALTYPVLAQFSNRWRASEASAWKRFHFAFTCISSLWTLILHFFFHFGISFQESFSNPCHFSRSCWLSNVCINSRKNKAFFWNGPFFSVGWLNYWTDFHESWMGDGSHPQNRPP